MAEQTVPYREGMGNGVGIDTPSGAKCNAAVVGKPLKFQMGWARSSAIRCSRSSQKKTRRPSLPFRRPRVGSRAVQCLGSFLELNLHQTRPSICSTFVQGSRLPEPDRPISGPDPRPLAETLAVVPARQQMSKRKALFSSICVSGAYRDRTGDLRLAKPD